MDGWKVYVNFRPFANRHSLRLTMGNVILDDGISFTAAGADYLQSIGCGLRHTLMDFGLTKVVPLLEYGEMVGIATSRRRCDSGKWM